MFGGDLNTAQFAEYGDELAGEVDPPERPGAARGVIAVAWFFDIATGAPPFPAASLLRHRLLPLHFCAQQRARQHRRREL